MFSFRKNKEKSNGAADNAEKTEPKKSWASRLKSGLSKTRSRFSERVSSLILGKKENNSGEAFLKDKYNELGDEKALVFFQQSSDLGYSKGQVNLATMYINGNVVDKDLNKALYWLKAASLNSHKQAILKYGIICNQVPHCDEYSFYQELYNSGVNIKVRELKRKPKDIVNTKK